MITALPMYALGMDQWIYEMCVLLEEKMWSLRSDEWWRGCVSAFLLVSTVIDCTRQLDSY